MAITPYPVSDERPANPNVADLYSNSTLAEIRADLETKRTPLVNICMNLTSDFNKSSVIRANNAYCGKAVYLVGNRKFDRRGAVGTQHYEHVFHADTLEEVVSLLREDGYTVYAVDNQDSYLPVNLWDAELPERVAFVYGEEQKGLDADSIALCDGMVFSSMYGSVRSLNVAQAAAVFMSEYARRHR